MGHQAAKYSPDTVYHRTVTATGMQMEMMAVLPWLFPMPIHQVSLWLQVQGFTFIEMVAVRFHTLSLGTKPKVSSDWN